MAHPDEPALVAHESERSSATALAVYDEDGGAQHAAWRRTAGPFDGYLAVEPDETPESRPLPAGPVAAREVAATRDACRQIFGA